MFRRPLCSGGLARSESAAELSRTPAVHLTDYLGIMNAAPADSRKNLRELVLEIGVRVLLFGVFV